MTEEGTTVPSGARLFPVSPSGAGLRPVSALLLLPNYLTLKKLVTFFDHERLITNRHRTGVLRLNTSYKDFKNLKRIFKFTSCNNSVTKIEKKGVI